MNGFTCRLIFFYGRKWFIVLASGCEEWSSIVHIPTNIRVELKYLLLYKNGATAHSITTFSITTLSIMTLSIVVNKT